MTHSRHDNGENQAKADQAVERSLVGERIAAKRAGVDAAMEGLAGLPITPELQALIDGSAPDDARRLSEFLGLPTSGVPQSKTSDELVPGWQDGGYPYKYKMLRKDYEREKFALQSELLKLQGWIKETEQRVVILFEGRDAAGKGGAIKRFMEHMNPREIGRAHV